MTAKGLHLIYEYFRVTPNPRKNFSERMANARQREYDECLYRNLTHKRVERIHLFLESPEDEDQLDRALRRWEQYLDDADREKIQRISSLADERRRMKYSDAFEYANNHLAGKVTIIMNADIFLGGGVSLVLEKQNELFGADESPCVLSLTRHEKTLCTHAQRKSEDFDHIHMSCGCPFMQGEKFYAGSHDSFWFVPPVPKTVIERVDHVQNRWGSEHSVINALLHSGYTIINPSRSIITFHNHESALRPWKEEGGAETHLADPRDHIPLPPTFLRLRNIISGNKLQQK